MARFPELASGLDGGQSFIDQFDRESGRGLHFFGEGLRLLRALAEGAVHVFGESDDDIGNALLSNDGFKGLEEFVFGFRGDEGKRAGKHPHFIAQGDPDPLRAVIQGHDSHWGRV